MLQESTISELNVCVFWRDTWYYCCQLPEIVLWFRFECDSLDQGFIRIKSRGCMCYIVSPAWEFLVSLTLLGYSDITCVSEINSMYLKFKMPLKCYH